MKRNFYDFLNFLQNSFVNGMEIKKNIAIEVSLEKFFLSNRTLKRFGVMVQLTRRKSF